MKLLPNNSIPIFLFSPARRASSAVAAVLALLLAGCATPGKPTTAAATPAVSTATAPSAEAVYKQQRIDRAKASLAEGLKRYDAGNFPEALSSFAAALDSGGILPVADQLVARKHVAFIHAVSHRDAASREEFEKAFLLDPGFTLSAAEAGHPAWGPIFRAVKSEVDLRRSGISPPSAQAVGPTIGERLLASAMAIYDQGDYNRAIKTLQDALKESLTVVDRVKALKFTAFSYCLTSRNTLCRAEFEKIFQVSPDFVLEPAEAGHPSWGPSFRAVKARQTAPKK